MVFEFRTPFIIGATPPNDKPWGIYDAGCRNGLVLRGKVDCPVAVSTDRGRTWQECGRLRDGLDLTDHVKGYRQYLLRLGAGTKALQGAGLTITTVCQANPAVMPRLKDNESRVWFHASGRAVLSAGPTLPQAEAHVVEGRFGSPKVTLELKPPRGETVLAIHAAAHQFSGSPPNQGVKYQIEFSLDGGSTWEPIVRDWSITRRGDDPKDFWSQSLCWGTRELSRPATGPVRIRFSNTGGRTIARAEAHLVYRVARADATRVTFAWSDDRGARQASHDFLPEGEKTAGGWNVPTGRNVKTRWVEFEPVAR
jgi:hypothetical protein